MGSPGRPLLHLVETDYYFAAQVRLENQSFAEEVWKTDLAPQGAGRSSFDELTWADPSAMKDALFGFFPNVSELPGTDPYVDSDGLTKPFVETTHGRFFVRSRWNQARVDGIYRIRDSRIT